MARLIWMLFSILCVMICRAQSISQETALRAAQIYWNTTYAQKEVYLQRSNNEVRMISPNGKAALYVIQMDDGWVLVSSEKAATPILASSPSGIFPKYEDMPDGMKWIVSYYEDANQYARDSIDDERVVHKEWNQLLAESYAAENNTRDGLPTSWTLDRMALVKWNQGYNNDYSCIKPYNAHCPSTYNVQCGKTVVGCGAVALGMVMWYWQWPWSAIIPRQLSNNTYVNVEHFAMYDWAHMPPELHDTTQTYDAGLLAYFLRDCGYAIKMQYGNSGSSSYIGDTRIALKDIFHYKSTVLHKYKNDYSSNNWITLLKQEISAGRPVIYRGSGSNGGHAFVLFGYTSDDKFRINWGWGGDLLNASYSLEALTPSGYDFNSSQAALIGIEPDSPPCVPYNFIGQSDVSGNLFEIHKSGILVTDSTHGEIRIHSNQRGCIYANDAIVIYPPFVIESGAQVHLTLRDALCNNEGSQSITNAPDYLEEEKKTDIKRSLVSAKNASFSNWIKVSPNPAINHINVTSDIPLERISLINIDGVRVLESEETWIDITHLPLGFYVIDGIAKNGLHMQAKLLKQ